MATLLVGFDSAWTPNNSGAIVGLLRLDDGTYRELGSPLIVDYPQAEGIILRWQAELAPTATIVLLDQPTIVKNASGQRPVENIVASAVSLRYGGMQPAGTSREEMFGPIAPVWKFLARFGGPADPLEPISDTRVFETYPVLAMIALLWTLPDSRPAGRLPKYNPERKKTFSISDWRHVCGRAFLTFCEYALPGAARWMDDAAGKAPPRKTDQDGLDAYLCLLAALHLVERKTCLMVGDRQTGYIVVPYGEAICSELQIRCNRTGRQPSEWVRAFQL